MPIRFTDTDKWDNKWFRELSVLEKLCFNFICDRCDIAGFYEIDLDDMEFKIKTSKDEILGALKGLERTFIIIEENLKDSTVLWIKKFIYHQKNLPINPSNPAHKKIIKCINQHPEFYKYTKNEIGAFKELISSIGISNNNNIVINESTMSSSFYPPTLEQIDEYVKEKKLTDFDCEYYFNARTSTGWKKVNGQIVKNWKLDLLNVEKKGWCKKENKDMRRFE